MMHRVCRPKNRNLVAQAMKPVITEVPGKRGNDPRSNPTRRKIEPGHGHIDNGEIFEHVAPKKQADEPGEISACCAERTRTQTIDRIIGTKIVTAFNTIDN